MDSLKPYMKAIVASVPAFAALIATFVSAMGDQGLTIPPGLALLVAALTALGVYKVPNRSHDSADDV